MKNFLTITFLLIAPYIFSQIGTKVQSSKPSLVGKWVNNSFGFEMILVLNQDGSGNFDGEKITFSTTASSLSITENGQKTNYNYQLNGNSLILSGGDLDGAITFSKNSSNAQKTVSSNLPTESKSNSTTPQNLIGAWSANGETVVFNNNNTGTYNGNLFNYSVLGNTLTTSDNTGSNVFYFSVNGNYLTLNGSGLNVVLQRGNSNGNTSNSSIYNQNQGGGIDQSIVGKWCYVSSLNNTNATSSYSRCIVINGNGTYQYYAEGSISGYGGGGYGGSSSQSSDSGTWKLAGNQIQVQSRAEGYKVYTFEKRNHPKNGDPMIIIDGDPYVSYYQKAPWK